MRRRSFLGAVAAGGGLPLVGTTGSGRSVPPLDERRAKTTTQGSYAPTGSVEIPGAKEATVHHDGEIAYVATGDGFVAVDISEPASPRILAERREVDTESDEAHSGRPFRLGWDLWAAGDRLAVAGPAHPAPGSAQGFALFDVSDPAAPEQVAWHATNFYIHNAFFADDTVYLTGSGLPRNPLVIVDVSDDEPEEVGRWSIVDHDQQWATVPIPMRSLHDVYVQDGIAYLPYWDAGTWLVDVSDPTAPEFRSRVGAYTLEELTAFTAGEGVQESGIPPGNDHFATVNDDGTLMAVGKEAWASASGDGPIGGPGGVDLWDVSDPSEPEKLAGIDAPDSYDQTDSGWFTTAHNCDFDGDRLYTSWYFGGVKVHDVSDPSAPEELAWWRDPRETSFWTAQGGAAGDAFVGCSTNVFEVLDPPNETRDALYVFPDRAGTQESPPDLTAGPTEPSDGSGTATPTPGDAPSSTATETATGTATETAGSGTGSAPTATPTATAADGDGPGFTVGGTLAGLSGLAYLLGRRHREQEE